MERWKKIMIVLVVLVILALIFILGINFFVIFSSKGNIISREDAQNLENVDCILILGAGIWGNSPSPMLEDRLLEGIALYEKNASTKIIMSGDHGREEYDEVNVMKNFAIQRGIKSEDIFMDHAGFSTYESIYRARDIFGVKKMIIVTQNYHLYRALYIAKSLGVEAYGVPSDPRKYSGQVFREIREVLARDKEWLNCIIKPLPTYLGETISVSGSGDITNDK